MTETKKANPVNTVVILALTGLACSVYLGALVAIFMASFKFVGAYFGYRI